MSPIVSKTRCHSFNEGFTLIESLVSIIVIGVLATIAVPSLSAWLNNKKIEDVATQVFGALEVSRSAAVRLNTPCTATVSGTEIIASPPSCFQSVPLVRTVDITNIATAGAGETDITFSPRGSTTLVENTSVIVIYDDESIQNREMQCIVVANGIGLMRQGTYTATAPPTSGDDIDAVEAACITPS